MKYNSLAGSSYTTLLKKLDYPRKGLINIQNIDDNECFKWHIVRHLNLAANLLITKVDQDFAQKLGFKDIKLPVKTRDIHETEKKNSIKISVLDYENKEIKIQSTYQ